ncbi:unnamed protein product [Prunus armeniaca]|uniref:Uncharacterized protein n=1 Tax=Prunus armeniaca TaxID=36596 RepID=A0A6J5WNX8_PRUAR|nr:unnamed protein product [Prunus armeniaca]CAB4301342.1 unnamed protein product [Prunus armeniaca]
MAHVMRTPRVGMSHGTPRGSLARKGTPCWRALRSSPLLRSANGGKTRVAVKGGGIGGCLLR